MTDDAGIGRALELARKGLGRCAPRPAVGAVLWKDGAVIGEGTTDGVGGPHAEVVAIADARARGADPRGATLFVTLEPCCHHGRTGPCTEAVLQAGIARVVVGTMDPNPLVNGRGISRLREAGVTVDELASEACARQIRGFAKAVRVGLPEVILKVATSLDGRIATASGESKWITSEEARLDGHRLRASCDAILVGIGTVLADDPALTVRIPGESHDGPIPVVLDSDLRIPMNAKVLAHPRGALIFAADDAKGQRDSIRVPRGLALEAVLRVLAQRGIHRVLVEGGSKVHGSLLKAGLVDSIVWYQAPMVIPGGIAAIGGQIATLGEATRFTTVDVRRIGPDLRIELDLAPAAA